MVYTGSASRKQTPLCVEDLGARREEMVVCAGGSDFVDSSELWHTASGQGLSLWILGRTLSVGCTLAQAPHFLSAAATLQKCSTFLRYTAPEFTTLPHALPYGYLPLIYTWLQVQGAQHISLKQGSEISL